MKWTTYAGFWGQNTKAIKRVTELIDHLLMYGLIRVYYCTIKLISSDLNRLIYAVWCLPIKYRNQLILIDRNAKKYRKNLKISEIQKVFF